MIKSKIQVPKITEFEPYSYQINSVTTYELINDTREFLSSYFKGAYKSDIKMPVYRRADISINGFSYILKIIFKSVFLKNLITVSDTVYEKEIAFNIEFDVELLSSEDISAIEETAKKSNIKVEFSKSSIVLKISTYSNFIPTVSAISIRKVYNSLINIFFN